MEITLSELVSQYYKVAGDVYIHGVLMVIVFEIITGLVKAFVSHQLNSSISLNGLAKHTLVILIIVTIYPYLLFIGFKGIANALVLFVIVSYMISIVENLDVIGVPVPRFVKKRLEKIKDEIDNKE